MKENKKYFLAPYVAIGYKDNILNLGYGEINTKIEDVMLQEAIIKICQHFKTPKYLNEVFKLNISDIVIEKCYDIITSKPYLISEEYKNLQNENRLLLDLLSKKKYPRIFLDKIKEFKVSIIGCGAIGTSVAMLLVSYGILNFNLFDSDIFENTNIMRCSYLNQDVIGLNKSIGLKEMLLKKNKDVNIRTHNKIFTEQNINDISDSDLIILSGDSTDLLMKINDISLMKEIPFITIGYAQNFAIVGPFVIPGKTSCIKCRRRKLGNKKCINNMDINIINKGYLATATPGLVSLSATIGVNEIIKFILDENSIAENKQLAISEFDYIIKYMNYDISNECECRKIKR